MKTDVIDACAQIDKMRQACLDLADSCGQDSQQVRVVVSILTDLRRQGWEFHVVRSGIVLRRPARDNLDLEEQKRVVREGLAVEREHQLRQPAVRTFVRDIEKRRIGPEGWGSVFCLMRDGRELAGKLQKAAELEGVDQQVSALTDVISPYIQIVTSNGTCEHTGLRLNDIWRYFRHTWANSYQSTVGREIKVLIRDAAVEHHPVIGIGALVSAKHLVPIDTWVQWDPKGFVRGLSESTTVATARWVHRSLEQLIAGIHIDDLIQAKLVRRSSLTKPSAEVINGLLKEAKSAQTAHKINPDKTLHKRELGQNGGIDWLARAESLLYRGNRAQTLAELLQARLRLHQAGFSAPTRNGLIAALESGEGRRGLDTIRRHLKSVHAGINMLDISICGAVAPYNHVLGGKLVAMMLASPEIVRAYEETYKHSASVIASSMAGRPVRRRPTLVALTTASLYGQSLNQYTRVSIPARVVGGHSAEAVRFQVLARTQGKGTHHITSTTVDEIETFLSQQAGGHRVHSIFGEGSNPRLRKIRSALDRCNFPSDYVLEHGNPRVLYGVALATNFREVLLGKAATPKYILPVDDPPRVSSLIARYWAERWLLRRLAKPGVLEQVAYHTLVSPIDHGARVFLPRLPGEEPLFEAFDLD